MKSNKNNNHLSLTHYLRQVCDDLFVCLPDNRLQCNICFRSCLLADNEFGWCGYKVNLGGKLFSTNTSYICHVALDPISKKPLIAYKPNTLTFSVACLGCNLTCPWCQNYSITQFFPLETPYSLHLIPKTTLYNMYKKSLAHTFSFTYSEPSVWFDFIYEFITAFPTLDYILVTNGHFNLRTFKLISKFIKAVNLDIKTFNHLKYNKINGNLEVVLQFLDYLLINNIHVEVTTLIVPGFNDSEDEILQLACYLKKLKVNNLIWHITRYFPAYLYKNEPTEVVFLKNLVEKIKKMGFYNVVLGNVDV